ncbi:hypothetical protein K2173_017178 [Erythroxylum novogranatense]|uniref:2-oxoglutarate-dependent dioxygenase DAO n=1 Tax=Erythroxylum novogranatense TaxID=1862640 RepID=A0AAV8U5Y6_9ROSI|nr:hypothetical protein K2173_017178 [Erythroxylum novogranatense]
MGSETETAPSISVIDFSTNLVPGTPSWDLVKSQVLKAAEECGCFMADFKGIPREVQETMDDALEELYGLPLETKLRNVSEKPYHGYIGQSPLLPLFEGMGFDHPQLYDNVDEFTRLMWPQGYPNFSKTIHQFSKPLAELDQTIRRMIVESLGVEHYVDEFLNSAYYVIRVAKYEAPGTTEKKWGLKTHKDQNVMSILSQNQINGLELQTKDGEWIEVKFSPDHYLVIFGEAFNAWTNGRLYCPYHRVMMSGNKNRYSAGVFSLPNEGYVIKAPKELVDEEHPEAFKPYEFIDYLKQRTKETGKTVEDPLKAYYGV